MASAADKKDVANAKRTVNNRAAKELTKMNKGGVKISRTNSNFKPSAPLKPGTPKANAKAVNKSKVALTKKYNARQNAINKMNAQGPKTMSQGINYSGVKKGK